ncbi:Sorting nexin-24 [Paramuricea clavata]|uniref:Sorting nexin-24 n=1 Tax=Paramuricea clavata TaxID=317549 RepID=A0A7D9K1R8_PARCT|nr:Sorting nexin-24 [Paramuricea clavata]
MDANNAFRNPSSVIKIDIPRFERVIEPTGKDYTVYKVVIAKAGGTKEIEKRYSEFDKLQRRLNKSDQLPRNIEFPPKTFIFNSGSIKEERRRKLRIFLQQLCDLNPIPEEVLAFLGISQPVQSNLTNSKIIDTYSSSEDLLDSSTSYTHQSLLAFTNDPYIFDHEQSQDDILLKGILDGIYEDSTTGLDVGNR